MENTTPMNKRKIWTREETLLFLECYKERQGEFQNSRKKRHAFANVLESMICKGFTATNVTPVTLEAKLRSLLLSYRAANDNNKQTGASQCSVPYFEQLNEIFGDKPCESHGHALSLGSGPRVEVDTLTLDTNVLPTNCDTQYDSLSSAVNNSFPTLCCTNPANTSSSTIFSNTNFPPSPSVSIQTNNSSPQISSPPNKRKKNAAEKFYEEKLRIKRDNASFN